MKGRTSVVAALVAAVLIVGWHDSASAQVVEKREGQSNPASVIFRATLYGAATGLVLGGAYALVDEDDDPSTEDILKWGTAGGAAAGALIGLVYVLVRSEPQGDAEVVGMVQLDEGRMRVAVPTVQLTEQRDAAGRTSRALAMNLFKVKF